MQALRSALPWHTGVAGESASDGLDATMRQIASAGFIQFHPALAERLGFKAALFLGHAMYWSRHLAKTQPKRNGWFFMTARQWQQATGLTTREQTNIREQLVQHGLLVEKVAGKPARMYFRVDLTRLAGWTGLHADGDGNSEISWEAFSPWMRGCVSFYRPLVDAAGSVSAALYLSYLLQAQRLDARRTHVSDGFFPVSQEDVRIALCLGPKTQRNARDRLKRLGLLHERYGLARVDLQALSVALGQAGGELRAPNLARTAAPVPDVPDVGAGTRQWLSRPPGPQDATVSVPQGQAARRAQLPLLEQQLGADAAAQLVHATRRMFAPAAPMPPLAQSQQEAPTDLPAQACQRSAVLSKLEVALLSKPGPQVAQNAIQTCRFVETNLPFCRTHIQEQSNTTTTTTGACAGEAAPSFDKTASRRRISEISERTGVCAEPVAEVDPSVRQADATASDQPELVLPKALPVEWHEAVRRTLLAAPPDVRQPLLDELQGQLGISGKTIDNPPGYLHALIRRHASGELVLAMADQVAAARAQRQRVQAAVARQAPAAKPADGAVPSDSAIARQALAQLRELRRQFAGGGGK